MLKYVVRVVVELRFILSFEICAIQPQYLPSQLSFVTLQSHEVAAPRL